MGTNTDPSRSTMGRDDGYTEPFLNLCTGWRTTAGDADAAARPGTVLVVAVVERLFQPHLDVDTWINTAGWGCRCPGLIEETPVINTRLKRLLHACLKSDVALITSVSSPVSADIVSREKRDFQSHLDLDTWINICSLNAAGRIKQPLHACSRDTKTRCIFITIDQCCSCFFFF